MSTLNNNNIESSNNDNCQEVVKKRIQWKLVERRNPKSYVIRSSSPCSAKEDLKMFVNRNQLQYRKQHKDPLVEFENLVEKLNLNDEDLLERAERRDLPAHFQQSYRAIKNNRNTSLPTCKRERRSKTPTVPFRRAAVPNVILDDYAFRRLNKRKEFSSLKNNSSRLKNDSICYMWLDNYDDLLNEDSPDNSKQITFPKYPNLINDDLLNRKLKQSPAAKVPDPHPPFGIPNSPIRCNYMETDYSNAKLDVTESQKRRFRTRETSPHLINDDLAFRNLRKDIRDSLKTSSANSSYCDINRLSSSFSSTNICLQKLREQLRPINRSTSLASSYSSSSISSPTTSSSTLDFPF